LFIYLLNKYDRPKLNTYFKNNLISRWDRRTLPSEPRRRKTLPLLYKGGKDFPVTFAYLIGKSRLIRRFVTFLIIIEFTRTLNFTNKLVTESW